MVHGWLCFQVFLALDTGSFSWIQGGPSTICMTAPDHFSTYDVGIISLHWRGMGGVLILVRAKNMLVNLPPWTYL